MAFSLKTRGLFMPDGELRPLVNEFRRLSLAAANLAMHLSITPKTEGELLNGDHPGVIESVARRVEDAIIADENENQQNEHESQS